MVWLAHKLPPLPIPRKRVSRASTRRISAGTRLAESGFTIIELMIVMLIIAALITVAAPSLKTMILTNQVRSATSDFLSDIAMSRSEASRRSQRVVLCASNDQNTCTSSANWAAGWISFVDADNNGQRNTAGVTEPILRVKDAVSSSVRFTTTPTGVGDIRFRAIGVIDAAKSIAICPVATGTSVTGRSITINALGRVQTVNATCP